MGFLNTCAGCNRHLKGEKLWSPSIDLWRALTTRASLDPRIYPWPGRFAPGLSAQGKVEKGIWKESVFEGNRVYTIKAFYNKAEEESRFTIPTGGRMSKTERKIKEGLLKARKIAFLNGQGITNPKSSGKNRGTERADMPPELLELVILDRYMRAIIEPGEHSVLPKVIELSRAEAVEDTGRATDGPNRFVKAYQDMIKIFPAVAAYEQQLQDNLDNIARVDKEGAAALSTPTRKVLAFSPKKPKGEHEEATDPNAIQRTDSVTAANEFVTTFSPFSSQSDNDGYSSSGSNTGVSSGTGVVRPGVMRRTLSEKRRQVKHPGSMREQQEAVEAGKTAAMKKWLSEQLEVELLGRVAAVGDGNVEGGAGFNAVHDLRGTGRTNTRNSIVDPALSRAWDSNRFTQAVDDDLEVQAIVDRISDNFLEYLIDNEFSDEADIADWMKTRSIDPASAQKIKYDEAKLKEFIEKIAAKWEGNFDYGTFDRLESTYEASLEINMTADANLKKEQADLIRAAHQIAKPVQAMLESSGEKGSNSPGGKATTKRLKQMEEKRIEMEKFILREKRKTKLLKIALLIIQKMKILRKRRIAKMKGKKRLRDAEAVATYTEGLLDAYAGRLDAIIQSGGPTDLSRLSKMRKKKGKSYTGNLGRVDEDITMGDAFNASGSGSGSGSGIGISSSVSSGSDGGSDSGTCEIPNLTRGEFDEFRQRLNANRESCVDMEGRAHPGQRAAPTMNPPLGLVSTLADVSPWRDALGRGQMGENIFKLRYDFLQQIIAWNDGATEITGFNYLDSRLENNLMESINDAVTNGDITQEDAVMRRENARIESTCFGAPDTNGKRGGAPDFIPAHKQGITDWTMTEDMLARYSGENCELSVIHWWSGNLILAALNKYCPRGGWKVYDDKWNGTNPTEIVSDDGVTKIILGQEIDGHWAAYQGDNRIYGERNGGDCGPCAVILAINNFMERENAMDLDLGGGGKRKTRKKYKRKYRKKTRRK